LIPDDVCPTFLYIVQDTSQTFVLVRDILTLLFRARPDLFFEPVETCFGFVDPWLERGRMEQLTLLAFFYLVVSDF
jgi:hypothetical protein